jgi:TrmH family RNA methyltransferase
MQSSIPRSSAERDLDHAISEIARRVRYYRSIQDAWKKNLRVVMVATRNPLNIGAAARAMANFGFSRLRVVQPYDVAFREARSAVGAAPLLAAAAECASVAEAVADCTLVVGTTSVGHRELQHPIRRLEYGARLIRRRLQQAPVALLFGSEKFGLSNDDLSHCHWLMRIPTVDRNLSMNLGQAVALCLYELARDARAAAARPEKIKPARAGDAEQLTKLLLEALCRSGYTNPVTETSTEEKVRRLVRRLGVAQRDVPVLLGMLRQMLWKMGAQEKGAKE